VVAAACYLWVAFKKRAPLDEYVVLLGALLISADVAFIESQWKLLGAEWQRHFLILTVVHAVAAYAFDSRPVLSLSLAALASWVGFGSAHRASDYAIRAFLLAAAIGIWRLANRRATFHPAFEHAAANAAFWGTIALAYPDDTHLFGVALAVGAAIASVVYGYRRGREAFVIYGYVYALAAMGSFVIDLWKHELALVAYLLVLFAGIISAMIATLWRMRR
jgi:hypothetical protein